MPIDYAKYPADWKTRIVPAIRKRSASRCEGNAETGFEGEGRCNAPHLESIVRHDTEPWRWMVASDLVAHINADGECDGYLVKFPIRVVLTVAHLDHDEDNHDVSLDRLRDLCQRCHLRYDSTEKARRARASRDHRRGQQLLELET